MLTTATLEKKHCVRETAQTQSCVMQQNTPKVDLHVFLM